MHIIDNHGEICYNNRGYEFVLQGYENSVGNALKMKQKLFEQAIRGAVDRGRLAKGFLDLATSRTKGEKT